MKNSPIGVLTIVGESSLPRVDWPWVGPIGEWRGPHSGQADYLGSHRPQRGSDFHWETAGPTIVWRSILPHPSCHPMRFPQIFAQLSVTHKAANTVLQAGEYEILTSRGILLHRESRYTILQSETEAYRYV